LLKVPRLGDKAFEQCAGFLRIKEGRHLLDASAVHPEAYSIVENMADDLGVSIPLLIGNEDLVRKIDPKKYVTEQFGLHTLNDILSELKKPGLDPRSEVQNFEFAQIFSIDDVQAGMIVPGIVTNLTRFGAFIDIGVKQDGLVHISEISHSYIADPSEKLKLNQHVTVKVTEVDKLRKRIALSIKQATPGETNAPVKRLQPLGQKKEKEKDLSGLGMTDALSLLKQKFGKP
jgi:uncharacterized protein